MSLAKDINIKENIDLKFICELEKKIIKNSEYNYQTFLAKDLDKKILDKFEIKASKPEQLFIKGLSLFCLLYTSPSPRDRQKSRMPSSA